MSRWLFERLDNELGRLREVVNSLERYVAADEDEKQLGIQLFEKRCGDVRAAIELVVRELDASNEEIGWQMYRSLQKFKIKKRAKVKR